MVPIPTNPPSTSHDRNQPLTVTAPPPLHKTCKEQTLATSDSTAQTTTMASTPKTSAVMLDDPTQAFSLTPSDSSDDSNISDKITSSSSDNSNSSDISATSSPESQPFSYSSSSDEDLSSDEEAVSSDEENYDPCDSPQRGRNRTRRHSGPLTTTITTTIPTTPSTAPPARTLKTTTTTTHASPFPQTSAHCSKPTCKAFTSTFHTTPWNAVASLTHTTDSQGSPQSVLTTHPNPDNPSQHPHLKLLSTPQALQKPRPNPKWTDDREFGLNFAPNGGGAGFLGGLRRRAGGSRLRAEVRVLGCYSERVVRELGALGRIDLDEEALVLEVEEHALPEDVLVVVGDEGGEEEEEEEDWCPEELRGMGGGCKIFLYEKWADGKVMGKGKGDDGGNMESD